MAITLSSSLSSKVEPYKQNRWVIQFVDPPGDIGNASDKLAFCAHTCQRPTIAFAALSANALVCWGRSSR